MKIFLQRSIRSSMVGETLLTALSVLFGLQLLRVLIPQLVWVFGDRFGMNAPLLGLIAVIIFAFSYLSGFFRKVTVNRTLVTCTAAGLGLTRLLVQIQWTEPLITLIISMIGTVLFGLFLASFTDEIRFRGQSSIGNMAIGLLSGFILDTAIHGAFNTYDMVWQESILPFILTIVLVLLLWIAAYAFSQREETEGTATGITWPWLAFGPFMFLQMVVFQNIARFTVVTGWDQPYVFGWILIAQITGLFAAILILRNPRNKLTVSIISGSILIVCTAFPYPGNPWVAGITVFAGHVSGSVLIVNLLSGTISENTGDRVKSITTATGTGFLLMGMITLAYYTGYQIKLPYENQIIEPVAAVIIALCALVTGIRTSKNLNPVKPSWIAPGLFLLLLILPLSGIIARFPPVSIEGNGFPVKLMTYNLHNGFDPKGDLNLEAIVKVIEEADPDIIVLQEISRGWLINGRVDMLDWLSQRLDMPYVSGPTEGPLWGNMILSSYPVVESADYELPPRDLFLRRGLLVTKFDIGNNETLRIIATHLHHIVEDSEIRQQQIPVILDYWDNDAMTVITGDMNAHPDAPEMAMLRNAGFIDSMADTVPPEGYTYNSVEPFERIDYIWITPDLKAENTEVIQVSASDHMPVITELSR